MRRGWQEFATGQQNGVGAGERGWGLAQKAWECPATSPGVFRIHKHKVEVAVERHVLKAVIEQMDINRMLGFEKFSSLVPRRGHPKRDLQIPQIQLCLVPGVRRRFRGRSRSNDLDVVA
jgi:hypothetical protein